MKYFKEYFIFKLILSILNRINFQKKLKNCKECFKTTLIFIGFPYQFVILFINIFQFCKEKFKYLKKRLKMY